MTYTGKVQKGVVIFDGDIKPQDGSVVRIEEVAPPPPKNGSIWDALREIDGTATGLPEDMAENHDHYIHGAPKRSAK